MVKRDVIYDHLWPDCNGNVDASRPYEQQITDHKKKIIDGIRKSIKNRPEIDPAGLKNLIRTKPGVGYMLYMEKEEIIIL